jgi:NADH-quinone oxidoreductase chain G
MNVLNLIVKIDDQEINVPSGYTILQAAELAGIFIPRFCYHADLSVAGNCRMCLVAVAGSPKLAAACMMPIADKMHIYTDSVTVRKAQQGVMEHLLVNHPLDCPICDQGGECDLQDQAQYFGTTQGRFLGIKRAVEDKDIGPFIKTVMTRCIHCTRCIRFASEIAGISLLGTFGRGRGTEVGTYVEKLFKSEISGNVIDLCPVGALTSKPSAFTTRSWESKKVNSVDLFDGIGTTLTLEIRGVEISRILPFKRTHQSNWISDKARFNFDGLSYQRLSTPLVLSGGSLTEIDWLSCFKLIKLDLSYSISTLFCLGNIVDLYTICQTYGNFLKQGGGCWLFNSPFLYLDIDFRSNFLYNERVEQLKEKDACILVNCNPKQEGAVFYGYLKQRMSEGTLKVYQLGSQCDKSFISLGSSVFSLLTLIEGRNALCKDLSLFRNIALIKGINSNQRQDSQNIDQLLSIFLQALAPVSSTKDYLYLDKTSAKANVFPMFSNQIASFDMGIREPFSNAIIKKVNFDSSFFIGFDSYNSSAISNQASRIYYYGHHYDVGASTANIILPMPSFFEKKSLTLDMQGLTLTLEPIHTFTKSVKESVSSSLPFLL